MSKENQSEAPKKETKRFGCMKVVLYFVLALFVLFLIWVAFNFRPAVKSGHALLPVSTELTILTEPLDENGDVDYLEALNQQCADGVTPETNAMVKFAEALGPQGELPGINPEYCERLGIPELPDQPTEGNYFVPYFEWKRQDETRREQERFEEYERQLETGHIDPDKDQDAVQQDDASEDPFGTGEPDELMEFGPFGVPVISLAQRAEDPDVQFKFAERNPWSAEDVPDLEKWLRHNASAFDVFEEGLHRSSYYRPMISDGVPKSMIKIQSLFLDQIRDVSKCFAVRAMLRLQQGNIDASIKDVEANFRLAEFVSRGPTITEGIIGVAIASQAHDCAMQIAIHEKTSREQLEELQQQLENVKPFEGFANRIDRADRYMALDVVKLAGRGDLQGFGVVQNESWSASLLRGLADPESACKVINDQFDMSVEFMRSRNGMNAEQREASSEDLYARMRQQQRELINPWNLARMVVGGRKGKGRWVGFLLADILTPSLTILEDSQIRANAKLDMARLGVAVCRFKKANGKYPESLDQLVPKFVESLPVDVSTDRPLVYDLTEDGFWIHSELWDPPVVDADGEQSYDSSFGNKKYVLWPRAVSWEQFLDEY